MGDYGDRARQALLDSAEELFAVHGIDGISNRRIAEHAGNANHSAVKYHFGGRDGLVRALLNRHAEGTRIRRQQLVDLLGPEPGLRDLLSCQILPATDQLAALPAPSRRARMLRQLRAVPSMVDSLAEAAISDPLVEELIGRTVALLTDVPNPVLRGRSWILGRTIIDVCAEYEERIENETIEPDWTGLGHFLIDVCVGMLGAPVTSEGDFLGSRYDTALP